MPYSCASKTDAGTRLKQEVTKLTPQYVKNGYRMEDAHCIIQKSNMTILAVSDGHGSTKLAPGYYVGANESATAAIQTVRQYPDECAIDPELVFARANEAIRTQVSLELTGVSTFRSSEETQPCKLWLLNRPQPAPFHGATLTMLCILPKFHVRISHVGDSLAMFIPHGGEPVWLHEAHERSNAKEHERVTLNGAKGSQIDNRVKVNRRHQYNYLVGMHMYRSALTRSLGCFGVAQMLPLPETFELVLGKGVILVGTSGFWQCADVDVIKQVCNTATTPAEICDACMEKCVSCPYRDNATVVCALLDDQKSTATSLTSKNDNDEQTGMNDGVPVTVDHVQCRLLCALM